jgi:hypothetical protein
MSNEWQKDTPAELGRRQAPESSQGIRRYRFPTVPVIHYVRVSGTTPGRIRPWDELLVETTAGLARPRGEERRETLVVTTEQSVIVSSDNGSVRGC